jgi:hypothetical protein
MEKKLEESRKILKEIFLGKPQTLLFGFNSLSVCADDKFGLRSILYTLTFKVMPNAITTVRGAHLPPTIGTEKKRK